ncbi:MAG TPA: tetratricopeptide repeat protein [Terriglobia bacterium]|nr:tetratricopeptide repeat protein [Terriglobia bacterium]
MTRIHYFVFAILLAAGLGLAALLVPGKGELALLQFKAREYEIARQSYEERLAAGNRSADVVLPLTQLYLQYGDVDKAVELMKRFVDENPKNLEALQRLGKLFQYAERPRDYLKILERIAILDPSESNLRSLSNIYNLTAQYDDQINTLLTLVQKYPAQPRDFIDLASLQASRGSIADAESTIERFDTLHPDAMTAETVELHLNLLVDNGRASEAPAVALVWLRRQLNYDTAVQFADLLNFKKQPAMALRLLQPFDKAADTNPNVLRKIVDLHIALGELDVPYERLKSVYAEGKLPAIVVEPFVDLALAHKESDFAIAIVRDRDLTALPNWLLANLAETALAMAAADDATNPERFLDRMARELGDDFLADRPVLGAQLAIARNDASSAQKWIDRAESKPNLDETERLELGNVYVVLNRRDDALRCYEQVALEREAPDYLFSRLASLYLELGKAKRGLGLLNTIRERRPSLEADAAWALVATAAGEADRVLKWFKSGASKALSLQSVSDLYFAANEARHPKLVLATAQRLDRQRHNRSDQLHLALALTGTNKPAEALQLLRPLLSHPDPASAGERANEEEAYVAALTAALRDGKPVAAELRKFWSARLAQSSLPESRREEIIYGLLDLKDYSAVLPDVEKRARGKNSQWLSAYVDIALRSGEKPRLLQFLQAELARTDLDLKGREDRLRLLIEHGGYAVALQFLRPFADSRGGEWVSVYQEALASLNRKPELIAFLRERANKAGIDDSERTSIANRLLDLGDKRSAENLLLQLAAGAGPGSREVSQLLYLWGPRPAAPALEWLEARGRSASAGQRAAWMQHLINAGAAKRAAGLATRETVADKSVLDAYISALVALNDRGALSSVIRQAVENESEPARLRRLGRVGLETQQMEPARNAFQKLLSLRTDDREALKRLASMALWEGDFSRARQFLSRLVKLGDLDYETHFYLGEALSHDHDRGARAHYERALDLLEGSQEQTGDARVLRAQLLQRMGRSREALAAFENVLKAGPGDTNVRSEYAAVLVQAGRYEDAKRIIAATK